MIGILTNLAILAPFLNNKVILTITKENQHDHNYHPHDRHFDQRSSTGNADPTKHLRDQPRHQRPAPLQLHHSLHPRRLPYRLLGVGAGDGNDDRIVDDHGVDDHGVDDHGVDDHGADDHGVDEHGCVFPISHFGICYEAQLINTKIKMSKSIQLSRAINLDNGGQS